MDSFLLTSNREHANARNRTKNRDGEKFLWLYGYAP